MERRSFRVSEAQWCMILEFLEKNPRLARSRGYNNSARGRAESSRLWQEMANLLNAEKSGAKKTAKDWSVYVSNYKSKLKKTVAEINVDGCATGDGSPRASTLSDIDCRFLAIMDSGFAQTAPQVSIQPFPHESLRQQPISATHRQNFDAADVKDESTEVENIFLVEPSISVEQATNTAVPHLPRLIRRKRLRSHPLTPLGRARRILSQAKMQQRVAADESNARALNAIAQNLGRLADAAEKYLSYLGPQ